MGGFTTALNRADSPHHRGSLVSLDDITLLDVLKPFDRKTAFIAGGHFAHIIFEAFQRIDLTFKDNDALTDHAGVGDLQVASCVDDGDTVREPLELGGVGGGEGDDGGALLGVLVGGAVAPLAERQRRLAPPEPAGRVVGDGGDGRGETPDDLRHGHPLGGSLEGHMPVSVALSCVVAPAEHPLDLVGGLAGDGLGVVAGRAGRQGVSKVEIRVVVEERHPDAGVLNGIRDDVRYALRSLRQTPGYAAVVVLTLGLGIGAATSTQAVIDPLLLRPLAFHDPDLHR